MWKTVVGVMLLVLAGLSLLAVLGSIGALTVAMETDDAPRAIGAFVGKIFWTAAFGLIGYLLLRRPKPKAGPQRQR